MMKKADPFVGINQRASYRWIDSASGAATAPWIKFFDVPAAPTFTFDELEQAKAFMEDIDRQRAAK